MCVSLDHFIKLVTVQECSIETAFWPELSTEQLYAIATLRTSVFYREQRVDDEELDGRDLEPTCEHYWIADSTGVLAYLRVLHDDKAEHLDAHTVIGRVVTRADQRGKGLASALLTAVIDRRGTEPMLLHAQTYAAALYAKAGFVPFGEPFDEAGIEHVSMYRAGSQS
jgi:ElaA protein